MIAFLLLMFGANVEAGTWANLWYTPEQQAQQALEAGNAGRAAQLFKDPRRRAYAQIQAKQYDAAAKELAPLGDPESEYNRGNALARAGDLKSALDAYDSALKQSAADSPLGRDAKHNRDLVARQLQQQQQGQPGGQPSQSQKDRGKSQEDQQPKSSGQGGQQQGSPQSAGQQPGGQQPASSNQGNPQQANQSPGNPQQGNPQQANQSPGNSQQGNPQQANQPPGNSQQGRADQNNSQAAGAPDSADRASAAASQADKDRADQAQAQRDVAQALQQKNSGWARGSATQDGQAAAALDKPPTEQALALDQWLRQIPDDPGGLLRRKFLIEHRMQQREESP